MRILRVWEGFGCFLGWNRGGLCCIESSLYAVRESVRELRSTKKACLKAKIFWNIATNEKTLPVKQSVGSISVIYLIKLPVPGAVDKPNSLKIVEFPLPQYQKNGKKYKIKKDNGRSGNGSDGSIFENEELELNKEEKRNQGIETAKRYLEIMRSERIQTRADLARRLKVSRARVTQVLRRLQSDSWPPNGGVTALYIMYNMG